MSTNPNQTFPYRDNFRDLDRDQCADARAPINTESAATPEARLAAAVGGLVHEALRTERLLVVEQGSSQDLWRASLRLASCTDPAAVPALIDSGARFGWIA